MRVQILGPVRIWRGEAPVDIGSAGQRAVLGLLALAGGQPLSRGELIQALWGERPPPSATNMIQTRVKHLRHALEPDRPSYARSTILPMVGDGYALELAGVDLDLSRFHALVTNATASQRHGDFRQVTALLAEALRLWRGAPLADIPALAGHPKVTALAEQRRTALAQYGEAMLATGATDEAVLALEEAAAGQPLDEAAWARLIRAYGAAGQRSRAFAAYHAMRERLIEELGVDPGADLAAAHAALLRDDVAPVNAWTTEIRPSPSPPAETPAAPASPVAPIAPVVPAHRRPTPAQLPADVPAFTGRAEQLTRLDALLETGPDGGSPVAIATISGMAGVGKTALAVHWGHRVRDRFADGQLYVNLRGFDPVGAPLKPVEVMEGFLDALGVPPQQMPTSPSALTGLYRSVLADKSVLLILDNARDADQVRPLLPGARRCFALVTSRNRLTSLIAIEGARPLALDLLPSADSRRLMARRLGAERIAAELAAVHEIIDACARLPLALAVATAHAAIDPDVPLAELAAQLRGARNTLDALAGEDPASDVRAVFSMSYQALTEPVARLFRLLGLYPGPDVPVAAAASLTGVPTAEARSLLGDLVHAHLVDEPNPGRFRMHDLVRVYAAELVTASEAAASRRAAIRRLLDYHLHTAHSATLLLNPHQDRPPWKDRPRGSRPSTCPTRAPRWPGSSRSTPRCWPPSRWQPPRIGTRTPGSWPGPWRSSSTGAATGTTGRPPSGWRSRRRSGSPTPRRRRGHTAASAAPAPGWASSAPPRRTSRAPSTCSRGSATGSARPTPCSARATPRPARAGTARRCTRPSGRTRTIRPRGIAPARPRRST
ncbi:winged helix-turn-helix domain-containing protein [Streptosporangiaceae bacterium NEAU-GS5]|nr:winged helix-turn-helix domain-containing protein [Streptosporangiaceae bacterium NEAU-GS5]